MFCGVWWHVGTLPGRCSQGNEKGPATGVSAGHRAIYDVEAAVGIEPTYGALQAAIAPLEPLQTVRF